MYLGIDIGGTKTAVASFNNDGAIKESFRFPTPKTYSSFLKELAKTIDKITTKKFAAAGVGVPGKIDRERGVALAFGRLHWRHTPPIQDDVKKLTGCRTIIDNDANLAGLSEAMLLAEYSKVLYITISTGIGTGFIVDQAIDPELADSEGGIMLLEHNGKLEAWEDFASGSAIVKRFGKKAYEITDEKTWKIIAHDIALGLIDLIALTQPDVVVLGGGVGTHYKHFEKYLKDFLHEHKNPLFKIPPVREAARPEEAVLFGCYELAKAVSHGKTA